MSAPATVKGGSGAGGGGSGDTTSAAASGIELVKYHGLGNDYFVLDPTRSTHAATANSKPADVPPSLEVQRHICHRQYGLGSDGILFGPVSGVPTDTAEWRALALTLAAASTSSATDNKSQPPTSKQSAAGAVDAKAATAAAVAAPFFLRIYNSDGTEAKKSGNGLRIFSRYLYDTKRVTLNVPFRVQTLGGCVTSTVRLVAPPSASSAPTATATASTASTASSSAPLPYGGGLEISVEMGEVVFDSTAIPMSGPPRSSLNQRFTLDGGPDFGGVKEYTFSAASIGNPHCVLILPEISPALAKRLGPQIERHSLFPNRTNVQFLKVIDRHTVAIEIWERGSEYTLASGSSASASATVAFRSGLIDNDKPVTVRMPGGTLRLEISNDFRVVMHGPAVRVGTYQFDAEALTAPIPNGC